MDFQKVKNAVEPEVSVNDVSRISIGTIIKGEISSDCDIRVDGKVEGKIYSKGKVVVGPQAVINGGLACQNLDFWGKMKGDIYVKDVLTLKAKASIDGNVHVNKVQVEMGANLNGTSHMISPEEYEQLVDKFVTTKLPEKPVVKK